MARPLLEVIALSAQDAVRAEQGGADRLEVVRDMTADGLTPAVETVAEIARVSTLPQMVMLRPKAGFTITRNELAALTDEAAALAEAGAAGFVFGFLDPSGGVDLAATEHLAAAIAPLPWTFHRAVDHASADGWKLVRKLPGLTAVLTAGSPAGVHAGLAELRDRAEAGDAGLLLVGGGLRTEHLACLHDYGVRAFHVGSAVRPSWSDPVDPDLVQAWRTHLTKVAEA
ncbi:copper homeostasis protein CutC [Rhizohabitans arisaemae]|uniref:copper homeostasis protein CutC n=1 Tax=Rhizohabitans arisaemae TaxID=2720610 RepID=UPI0024B1683F|nr:copper homeostasis protein CutC [Rhizohabitans arisaemae]